MPNMPDMPVTNDDAVAQIEKINQELEELFPKLKSFLDRFFAAESDVPDRRILAGQLGLARLILKTYEEIVKREETLRVLAGIQILEQNQQLARYKSRESAAHVGGVKKIVAFLNKNRARVSDHDDEHLVVKLTENLVKIRDAGELKVGDDILIPPDSFFAAEKLPKTETEDWLIEAIPSETFGDIGGLEKQIDMVRDEIFLPYLRQEQFRRYGVAGARGILLEGPPGCGKTLIARALANELSGFIKEKTGKDLKAKFFAINGPELINWFVGRTEYNIRELFRRAKESAPSFIFIDEVESLVPARGSGISSDIEKTVVPQFLALMQGIEERGDVIVIGATNRKDLIDPAVLRSGRFDLKICVERPDKYGAASIFGKHLMPDVPLNGQYFDARNYDGDYYVPRDRRGRGRKRRYLLCRDGRRVVADYLIPLAVKRIFDLTKRVNRLLSVEYLNGESETMYFKDFISGAMIKGIVDRAKKKAIKREDASDGKDAGLRLVDLYQAIEGEFSENQDVPQNIESFKQWLIISGKKRQDIKNVELLIGRKKRRAARRIGFSPPAKAKPSQ